jgi:hypothetical protein
VAVHLPLDLLSLRAFVHEPEDLPVRPERAGRLDAGKPPPTLPLTLVQHPFEEGLEGPARDGLHHPGRILSYISAVAVKRVSSAIRQQKTAGKKGIGYTPIELSLDHVEEKETTIAVVLIFILGSVGVVLLIEVVLWRVGVLLSSEPRQIWLVVSVNSGIDVHWHGTSIVRVSEPLQVWQVRLVVSVDIGINVRRLGLSVGLLLLIPCVKAALDV